MKKTPPGGGKRSQIGAHPKAEGKRPRFEGKPPFQEAKKKNPKNPFFGGKGGRKKAPLPPPPLPPHCPPPQTAHSIPSQPPRPLGLGFKPPISAPNPPASPPPHPQAAPRPPFRLPTPPPPLKAPPKPHFWVQTRRFWHPFSYCSLIIRLWGGVGGRGGAEGAWPETGSPAHNAAGSAAGGVAARERKSRPHPRTTWF